MMLLSLLPMPDAFGVDFTGMGWALAFGFWREDCLQLVSVRASAELCSYQCYRAALA